MSSELITTHSLPRQLAAIAPQLPALFSAHPKAAKGFIDFFTATIRNKNTRRAYFKAANRFSEWCCTRGLVHLHASLRKVTKNRGSFPSEEAAFKLLYLALRNASKKWSTLQFWKEAMRQFEMIYPGRRDAARAA